MISAIFGFAGAMLVSVLLTPIVRKFATDLGAVDVPGDRRVHASSIPRLGGLAIIAGFFAALLAVLAAESAVAQIFLTHPMRALGLALGGAFICGIGVLDDIRGIRAWHKLWGQCAAGVIAYLCGFRIDAILLPFLGQLDMGVFGVVVTVFWIVAIINAINLIDGLDGLAGGVAFFACVTNLVVGFINQDAIVMLLSASLGGAVLGFLLFNFNPASIFMGDSGSMFLGYVLATTSILGNSVKSSTTVALLVPLIALGLPIMDTLLAMLRRFLERRSIFSPDRGHIHHQLLAMGITHRRAVLLLYALSVLFTAGSIIVSIGRQPVVGAALVVITIAVIGMIRAMGNFDIALRRWRRQERIRSATTERLRQAVPLVLAQLANAREVRDLPLLLREFGERIELVMVELTGPEAARSARDRELAGTVAPRSGATVPEAARSARDREPMGTVAPRSGASLPAPLEPFSWTRIEVPPQVQHNLVCATYELSALGEDVRLHFTWLSDDGEISPEADIMLQLVADACSNRINRLAEARRLGTAGHLRPV